ncbi:MAG: MFS transporter, partial [Pseudomonadota bacterium]
MPASDDGVQSDAGGRQYLTDFRLFVLAVASAVVTANAYYIHPIVAPVAADFGVDQGLIGIVPGANQIALALGVFLLLPLGDWISNRKLVILFATLQCLSLLGMALATDFRWFLVASTVLGFFTIAPYLLPTYVSKRVPVERLGHTNAVLTTGIIVGILIARAGSGVIAEQFGWRVVYYVATALMVGITLC